MNEAKRQAYLRVMDIQPYFPRQVLTGAKPSPHYELPEPSAVRADSLPGSDAVPEAARSQAKVETLAAVEALRADSKPTRKASVTPINKASEVGSEPQGEAEQEQSSLSFTLRYYRINENLAVLDEIPPQGGEAREKESLLLMQAILRALGQEFGAARAEEFSWPIQAGYSAKGSPQVEAAKAVAGFLQMRQETDGFTNLLVFAGQLEDVLLPEKNEPGARDFDSGRGYRSTITHSLASMLAVSTLKRDVWQHLQPLRERLASAS